MDKPVKAQQLVYLMFVDQRIGAQHPNGINRFLRRLRWWQQRLRGALRIDAQHERQIFRRQWITRLDLVERNERGRWDRILDIFVSSFVLEVFAQKLDFVLLCIVEKSSILRQADVVRIDICGCLKDGKRETRKLEEKVRRSLLVHQQLPVDQGFSKQALYCAIVNAIDRDYISAGQFYYTLSTQGREQNRSVLVLEQVLDSKVKANRHFERLLPGLPVPMKMKHLTSGFKSPISRHQVLAAPAST
jgi:hypothetical protein